tara:strand:+ start:3602 stop:4114 length:513 start_codon:yes stop_codon:yes gene_type:complete
MININEIKRDKTNLIEIYFINKNNDNYKEINIIKNKEFIDKIFKKYKFKNIYKYKIYYKNNLSYTYDLDNDTQLVIEKNLENNKILNNILVLSFYENKYPTYIFDCTNDIDHETLYNIYEYKINNRITLNIRKENDIYSLYIQYRHANNVDIEKIENIINKLINEINEIN